MGIGGLYVEKQLIDKCPELDGYIVEPNLEPPDDYGQLTHGGTIEQLNGTLEAVFEKKKIAARPWCFHKLG